MPTNKNGVLQREWGLMHEHSYKPKEPTTANDFFSGSVHTGKESFDPYVSGYAFIYWLALPKWVTDHSLKAGGDFKALTQKNFKSFSGISNIELETEGVKGGFTGNETHYTKGIGNKSSEFTLKYQEHSGSPLTQTYNYWVTGIRDPKTGIATYPAAHDLPYHSSNHTGTLLYVVTRPDADNFGGLDRGVIEHASLWTHVQPKRINLEHYNFEAGDHSFFELEQQFTGVFHFGPVVEQFAYNYIKSHTYNFITENSFENAKQLSMSPDWQ